MLQELPSDILASVLCEVGPPWPTIGASHAESQPSGVAALRSTSKSMMHLVDNCHGYWAASNLSRYGRMCDAHVPYHVWLVNHKLSNQCVYTPDTYLVRGFLSSDTTSHCLVSQTVGPACNNGHRATITAIAAGKQLAWHCHGFCTPRPHPTSHCNASCITYRPRVDTSDEYWQGHTGAVTAMLPVPRIVNDGTSGAANSPWPIGWVSASLDRTVKLWPDPSVNVTRSHRADIDDACMRMESPNTFTSRPLRTLRLHDEGVTCMTLVPVAEQVKVLLATGSADRTIALATLHPLVTTSAAAGSSTTGPKVATLRGHEKTVTCLACIGNPGDSQAPCWLASGGLDGRVKLWDLSRATGAGAGACKWGWKLGFPCWQLLPLSQRTTGCSQYARQSSCGNEKHTQPSLGAGSSNTAVSSCVAAVLSAGLQILDVRQDAPALYISHGRMSASPPAAHMPPTAAVYGHNLALCRHKHIAVYDIRMLTSSRPASGGGAMKAQHHQASKPRLVLSTQPARQLSHLSIDSYKVVAAAAPSSGKKSQSLNNRTEHPGPIFCWDVDTGQLLNDFNPVPWPADSPAWLTQKQPHFRPHCWPPNTDLLRSQFNRTNTGTTAQRAAGAAGTSQPRRQAAVGSTSTGSADSSAAGDDDDNDDNGGSGSWSDIDSHASEHHHDVSSVDVHGMAVYGSAIACVSTSKSHPGSIMSLMDFNPGNEIAREGYLAGVAERLQLGADVQSTSKQAAPTAGRFWA